MKKDIKEAKSFRNQILVCLIIGWIFTLFILIKKPQLFSELFIVPIGSVILTFVYFKMRDMVKGYGKLNE